MEELKDVTLHVYQLAAPEGSNGGSFLSRMLPSVGLGAYHTSLEIDGYRYTFAANAGIIKTRSQNEGIPSGATFKTSIDLGACGCRNRGEISAIIKKLSECFHGRSYHLVHRNCNHFTETFATALILHDELVDRKQARLKTYPEWVNRLANTSKMVVGHDDDITPCSVLEEARKAVGADEKVGWDLTSDAKASRKAPSKTSGQTKRTLTEKQKAALAKIRGGK